VTNKRNNDAEDVGQSIEKPSESIQDVGEFCFFYREDLVAAAHTTNMYRGDEKYEQQRCRRWWAVD
jgi:hypothetical protein